MAAIRSLNALVHVFSLGRLIASVAALVAVEAAVVVAAQVWAWGAQRP
jgi:hypothetical protein